MSERGETSPPPRVCRRIFIDGRPVIIGEKTSEQILGTKLEVKGNSTDWHRMVKAHTYATYTPTAYRASKFRVVAERLNINQMVVETTFVYISKLQRQGTFRKRHHFLDRGAFALACRYHDPATPLKPMAAAFGMEPFELARMMHVAADELHIAVPRPDRRRNYMGAVISLGLPHSFYLDAMKVVEHCIATIQTGGSETSFFGAALYWLAREAGRRVTQKKIAAALGMNEYTITGVCAKTKPHP